MKYFTGRVTDLKTQEVLPGANIYFLHPDGSVNYNRPGTSSDLDGTFDLPVNEGELVWVSFIGYDDQDIEIDGGMIYESGEAPILFPIEMEERVNMIPEAVIVGKKQKWWERPEVYVLAVLLILCAIALYRHYRNG